MVASGDREGQRAPSTPPPLATELPGRLPSPTHGVKLLTHAPFSGGSGRGLQPFTRPPLMRFQNLSAR